MIILPNTPPMPLVFQADASIWPSQLSSNRTSLSSSEIDTYNDLVRYLVNLEQYVEDIFQFASSRANPQGGSKGGNDEELERTVIFARNHQLLIGAEIPWSNTNKSKTKFKFSSNNKQDWYLYNEMEMALIAVALVYTRLGGELVNELIEMDGYGANMEEINEKWKQVITFHKKSISYIRFGLKISQITNNTIYSINGNIFVLIEKISSICLQLSILSKFAWINRNSFKDTESFTTTNNGTLSRVAIFILDELKNVKSLTMDLQDNPNYLSLNCNEWLDYLNLIEKYSNAYAGLFLSIDAYQQNHLGRAIGLINYSLLNLQSKKGINPKQDFKSKFSKKKNERYIKNLQSITSLNLNNSLFNDKSGIVLKDISYLFDQLIQLHLKFTKENDNLKFDQVTDYQVISKDNKWPLPSKIPVSDIETYSPLIFESEKPQSRSNYY